MKYIVQYSGGISSYCAAAAPAMREALLKIIGIPLKKVPHHDDDAIREASAYNDALEDCQEIARAGLNNVPMAVFEEFTEE